MVNLNNLKYEKINNSLIMNKYLCVNFSNRILIKKKIRISYMKKYKKYNIWNQDQYFKFSNFIFKKKKNRLRNKNFYFFKINKQNLYLHVPKYRSDYSWSKKKRYHYINKLISRPKNKLIFANIISPIKIYDCFDYNNNTQQKSYNYHQIKFLTKKKLMPTATDVGLPFKFTVIPSYYFKINELWRTRFIFYMVNYINKYKIFFPKLSIRLLLLYLLIGSLNYQNFYLRQLSCLQRYKFNWLRKKMFGYHLRNLKKNIFFHKYFFLNFSLYSYNKFYSNNLLNLDFNYNKLLKPKFNKLKFNSLEFKSNNLLINQRNKMLKKNNLLKKNNSFNSLFTLFPLNFNLYNKAKQKKIIFLQFFKHKWLNNRFNKLEGSKPWWLYFNKLKFQKFLKINFPVSYKKLYKNNNYIFLKNNKLINFIGLYNSLQKYLLKKNKNKVLKQYKFYNKPIVDTFVNNLNNFWLIWKLLWIWIYNIEVKDKESKYNNLHYNRSLSVLRFKNFNLKESEMRNELNHYFNHYSIFTKFSIDCLSFKYFKSTSWKSRYNVKLNVRTSSEHSNIWIKYFNPVLKFHNSYNLINFYSKITFLDYFKFNFKNLLNKNYLKLYILNKNYTLFNFNVKFKLNNSKVLSKTYNIFNIKNSNLNNVLYTQILKLKLNKLQNINFVNSILLYLYMYLFMLNKNNINLKIVKLINLKLINFTISN